MSLSRLALRLATIEALAPTALVLGGEGTWPTVAGKRVFDSRQPPIEDLNPQEAGPVVCVYTDDDDAKAGQSRGGPPFLTTIDLVFELSVPLAIANDADPNTFVLADPQTDPQLEAGLDFLGAQIAFGLLYAPAGKIWRDVCGQRVQNPRSTIHRTSEEGVRLARRTLTWRVEVNGDRFDPAPAAAPTGTMILPEPLRSVAAALPEGSYGTKIINGLIVEPTAPVMPVAVPLNTVGLDTAAMPPGAVPAAGQTPNINGEVDGLQD